MKVFCNPIGSISLSNDDHTFFCSGYSGSGGIIGRRRMRYGVVVVAVVAVVVGGGGGMEWYNHVT